MDIWFNPYSSNTLGGFQAPKQTNKAPIVPTQPMMSYNVKGNILSWVDDEDAKKVIAYVDSKAKSDDEKKILLQEAHQAALKATQQKQFKKDREEIKAQLMTDMLDKKSTADKTQLWLSLKIANFSDIVRQWANKEWIDLSEMDDKTLIAEHLKANPNQQQLFLDYANGKKTGLDVGRELWLIQEQPKEEIQQVDSNVATDVVAWSLASTTGLPRFVANKTAEWIGRAAKQLWADEQTVNNLVESYKQSISEEQLIKEFGADSESMAFQGAKIAWDIIQTATPWWLIRWASKGTMLASKIDKLPLAGRIAKGAVEWLWETALYNIISEQKVWEPVNLWVWTAIGAVIPAGWAVLWAIGKKIAPSLEVSWLFAGGKLEKIRNTIIEEWVEWVGKNEKSDLWKWMLDRWFKGSKAEIATQTAEHAKKSKQMVDEILSESTTRVESPETTSILNDLIDQTSKTPWLEQEAQTISAMVSKDGKYTLSELNQAKRLMDEYYNIYKQSGDVGSSLKAKGLDNIRKSIRKTIEDVSDTEAEILGITKWAIKKLNNETQVATSISKEVSRREALDTAREMVSFLAGRSPWAIAGWLVGWYAGGWDWKDVVIGTILGSLATNTTLKTKVATMLNKLSGAEVKSLQRFITNKTPKDLPASVANKIEDIRINVLSDNIPENVWSNMNSMNNVLPANGKAKGLTPRQVNDQKIIDEFGIDPNKKPNNISVRKPTVMMKTPEEPLMVEARKYKSAEEFEKLFEYHWWPKEIKWGKLERYWAEWWDAGGIFTTSNEDYANIYSKNYWSNWAVHRVYVGDKKIIDLTEKSGINKFKDFIGKEYKNSDWEVVKFTKQDFDYLFPSEDWADRWAYDYHWVVDALWYDWAKILERSDFRWQKVTSTVLNEWGIKIYSKDDIKNIREEANKK